MFPCKHDTWFGPSDQECLDRGPKVKLKLQDCIMEQAGDQHNTVAVIGD